MSDPSRSATSAIPTSAELKGSATIRTDPAPAPRPTLVPRGAIPTLLEITTYRQQMARWEADQARLALESFIRDSRDAALTVSADLGRVMVQKLTTDPRLAIMALDWSLSAKYSGRTLGAYLKPEQYHAGLPSDQTFYAFLQAALNSTNLATAINISTTSLHITLDLAPRGI